MRGRVLSIAGTDPSGGAGIQADIKTVTALGGFATTAITALVAQNTQGVYRIIDVPEDFIAQQIENVLDDIGADAIKTGMLHTLGVMKTVADMLKRKAAGVPLVVDPVMVAKSGDALLLENAQAAVRDWLVPLATVVTPNQPEAEILAGMSIRTREEQVEAGRRIVAGGARAALIKGGHLPGETVCDVLVLDGQVEIFEAPRIHSTSTHGTGCTLSSAIATGLAQGLDIVAAVRRGRKYTWEAIRTAPGYGQGHGPLNHGHAIPDTPA